jgi:SAM-dependent methyltransferase
MPDAAARHSFGEAITRTHCRSCGGPLAATLADLGVQPPSNAYLSDLGNTDQRTYPLRAVVCGDCKLAQIDTDVPPSELFFDYAYFSSFSDTWLAHAKAYVDMAIARFGLGPKSFVVEIASNDGYLLKNMKAAGIPCLGVEPSDTVANAARRSGIETEIAFFDEALGKAIAERRGHADLIIANNVWAHIPDLSSFTAGIAALLAPDGVATIEVQHLLPLMTQVAFDTIYHEHFEYHSLLAAERVLDCAGLAVFDVEELPTHGGSIRLFVTHRTNARTEGPGLLKVRADEASARLDDLSTYSRFAEQVKACRIALLHFLRQAKAEGKTVAAYGAAAKGNTLLNYCAVRSDLVAMAADRNPHKQGKFLPGSHIPIVSPEALMEARPDYVLILPWNIREEIMRQLDGIRAWGGRFLTPVPIVKVWD